MIKNKKTLEKEILNVIKEYNLFCITDIFAFYKGCSRATFYNKGLDKLDTIKEAIDDNRILGKQSLKSKWAESDNATLQIALFKIICTDEERQALSQSYIGIKSGGKEMNQKPTEVIFINARESNNDNDI